uniref:Palmitoyltransferase n=1 Tax=Scylla olivacea TaxID=85551 RepID=A0A0P4W643_SCYOL
MQISKQFSCTVQVSGSVKKPTAILVFAERARRCLGWMKTFVPVAAITVAEDKWHRIPNKNKWENVEAEIRADFEKLAAMDGEGRRVKVKVKVGKRTHFKRVFGSSNIFDVVDASDFKMEEDQSVLAVMKDLLECFIMRRGQHRDVSDTKQGGDGGGAALATIVEEPSREERSSDGHVLVADTEEDVTQDVTLLDTAEGVKNGPRPMSETSEDQDEEASLSSAVMVRASPAAARHARAIRHALWTANLIVSHAAPLVYAYDTVLPLLEGTVPVLASRFTQAEEVTTLVQAACLAPLAATLATFHLAQLTRQECKPGETWCEECRQEVAAGCEHCDLCRECVQDRQYHSVLLNKCVGASNAARYRTLMGRLTALSVGMAALFTLEALMGQPCRLVPLCLLLCCAAVCMYCGDTTQ